MRYPADRFSVAPYLAEYYPALKAAASSWLYDPLYYVDTFTTEMAGQHLPTPDMLRAALPEGVLEPNGTVGGFVYFQRVEDGTARVTLRHDLVNASTGVELGIITIPFVVERPR